MSEPEEDFAAMFEASVKSRQFDRGETIEGTVVALGPTPALASIDPPRRPQQALAAAALHLRGDVGRGHGRIGEHHFVESVGQRADVGMRQADGGVAHRHRARGQPGLGRHRTAGQGEYGKATMAANA